MSKPYVIFQNVLSMIDVPIVVLCLWLAQVFFGGDSIYLGAFFYIFTILSVISWYIAAHISKLYSDLRTNKFSEEIVYIAFTVILHGIFLTSILFFFRGRIE